VKVLHIYGRTYGRNWPLLYPRVAYWRRA